MASRQVGVLYSQTQCGGLALDFHVPDVGT